MLHAVKLSYPHPDGQTATVEAPMPEDFLRLMDGLGLVSGVER
jgi:tRNA pseudouridine32 synthase/23S rRNA pseudouridine746 synthase